VLHGSAAIHEHADLSVDVATDLAELAGEFLGQNLIGGDPAPEEALELADLTGLETVGIAVDLDRPDLARDGSAAFTLKGGPRSEAGRAARL